MFIHFPISKNYHLEFSLFEKFCSDQFIVFDFNVSLNREQDHCPKMEFLFSIKSIKVFEFNIYNIHHADKDVDKPHKHITETEHKHE